MSILIRPALAADIPLLADVERSAAGAFLAAPGLEWIADSEPTPASFLQGCLAQGRLWVADGERGVSGFLAAQVMDSHLFIVELSVARPSQRHGIGTRLMAAVEAYARQLGVDALTLTTYRHLAWNAPYYARLGYAEVAPAELGESYVAKVAYEATCGHDPAQRCVMVKRLN
ncbi:GNAT family N-acetyltransferase [Pseudoduganella violacea]|uniref:GNAT superfamily N-acetyltransferase n=1 Tax=Pseudoduganella violacea TaxID=1715466 RepID=A0A7W5B898_9BURK|nr:GNAT family N-acetyltransferase [Pseudoduganella violacea]MBB3118256.1 GNAT superfamily N-acetyltransferase [Pseudoduganella violacea]